MKPKVRKGLKIFAVIFIILLGIVLAASWYLSCYLENRLHKTLVEQVDKQTNGLYKLKINKLSIELKKGVLHLCDITLQADSTKKLNDSIKSNLFFTANSIDLKIGKIYKLLKSNDIDIKYINLKSPEIYINKNRKDSLINFRTPDDISHTKFNKFTIDKINVTNGKLIYRNNDLPKLFADNINIEIASILIDSNFMATNKIPGYESIKISTDSIKYLFSKDNFTLNVKQFTLNTLDSLLTLDTLSIIPVYSKNEFARNTGVDYTTFKTGSIRLTGFDKNKIISDKGIFADSLYINNVDAFSYKNKKLPLNRKTKLLFHQMVQQIPVSLSIHHVNIKNGRGEYEELGAEAQTSGIVYFTDIHGMIEGLTNIVSAEKQVFTFDAHAKLYGEGQIDAIFKFPVSPHYDHFEVKGTLGGMHMSQANKMATPLTNIHIASGTAKHIDYSITGSSHQTHLDMLFLYNDLDIDLLKTKENGKKKTNNFLSAIANAFVILNDNPTSSINDPRRVKTTTPADNKRSNFNYLWRTMRDGIKATFGL